MKVIAERVWAEPAVAIGLLTTIALAVVAVVASEPWNASTILGIAAPFFSALGIRQLVSPVVGEHEAPPGEPAVNPATKLPNRDA